MTDAHEAQNLLLNRTCYTCAKDCKPWLTSSPNSFNDPNRKTCHNWKPKQHPGYLQ
jgi:hypothetical protein